ncbi:polypeptide N-acetylgalactosaminyltransferase 10-like [Lytechinus variegatus]|uniref:polypeptide N-acetylgalactosaminyltransferase 10-like n=1 Tax=Lytechinus variegatus TaxID=7654 RepID=UPI001BB11C3B|nr:polypeptide N-acetylgalactosaminyltransferase 10-like [Lytechinus variegatus]
MNIFRIRTRRTLRFLIVFIVVCVLMYAFLSSKPAISDKGQNFPRVDDRDSHLKFNAPGDQNNHWKEERHFEKNKEAVNDPVNFAAGEHELKRKDWHDSRAMENDKLRTGPGERGVAVKLTPEMKKTEKKDTSANGFNERVSDMISLDRALPDIRNQRCKEITYLAKLPNVSVIIPFHNEALSTLKRTVHSVFNRSPPELIHEIILVDDYSDRAYLKGPLDDYMSGFPKVKIIRLDKRQGLIRTRLLGAKPATGEVVLFLDSHCEANYNWLPPLLERIALNHRRIVCPMIDVISNEDFHYESQAGDVMRGAFDWELYYKRIPINEAENKRRSHESDPFRTPIMAGGLFAVDRKYFMEELGGYDEGLEIWGGEQYDLSFKVWMCGGEMEEIPCSRVGHIYRKFMSYTVPGGAGVINKNLLRVVEVWMDEWGKYFYERRPYLKGQNFGDISKQMALRERLQCKNFTWFLTEVAPDILQYYPPVEPEGGAKGHITHMSTGKCLTLSQAGKDELRIEQCSPRFKREGGSQYWEMTWHDDFRPGSKGRKQCVDFPYGREGAEPILYPCHHGGGNQLWVYDEERHIIYHPVSHLCLSVDGDKTVMSHCVEGKENLKWTWAEPNSKKLRELVKKHAIF